MLLLGVPLEGCVALLEDLDADDVMLVTADDLPELANALPQPGRLAARPAHRGDRARALGARPAARGDRAGAGADGLGARRACPRSTRWCGACAAATSASR
jgi:hypothetical protein